ncbi:MAG: hypothetical protein WBC22_12070 [Sedimentisphaerales bacterium]
MAKITFTLNELMEILISNELLPKEMLRPKIEGERIHFVIKTNSFILPFIPASLRYLSFNNNNAMLELAIVSSRLNKGVSWLNQLFILKLPAYMKLEYPKLFVDVDKLLKEKNIKDVRVKDIFFEAGELTIVTCNK